MAEGEGRTDIVFGKNAVAELLKSKRPVDTLYVALDEGDARAGFYISLAKAKGAVVKSVHALKLSAFCGSDRHQGVAAVLSSVDYAGISDILDIARQRNEPPLIVVADGIEDPHNLGAIIRTAEAAGAHGILISKRNGVSINATVQRTSAGAVNHIAVARVANMAGAVRELKKEGLFCFCADMSGKCAFDLDMSGPILLIVGSEGFGVSRLLRDISDFSVSLPMKGATGSLNASVAAGALIYEIVRQRAKG